jgi:hypothetical protein
MCEVHAPIPPLQQEGLGTESHPYPHARTRSSWITSKKRPCSLPKMPATPLLKMATVRPCLCVVGPHDWITLCSFTLFLCVGQLRPGAVAPKDQASAQRLSRPSSSSFSPAPRAFSSLQSFPRSSHSRTYKICHAHAHSRRSVNYKLVPQKQRPGPPEPDQRAATTVSLVLLLLPFPPSFSSTFAVKKLVIGAGE